MGRGFVDRKISEDFEDRIIFENFLLTISWVETSKVLLGLYVLFVNLDDPKLVDRASFGRWFEACWEEDGLIEDSNDDLDRHPNVFFVD